MDWLRLILAVLQLFGGLVTYLRTKQLLDAGGAQAIAKVLRAQADDLHKLQDAMADAGRRFDANGGVLPPDGKFRD